MRKIIFVAFCTLALIACKKGTVGTPTLEIEMITKDAIDVTPFSATLVASFNVGPGVKNLKTDMIYSTEPDPTWDNLIGYYGIKDRDYYGDTQEYHFRTEERLQPGTKYYYRPYAEYEIYRNDKEVYGEVKSFTTPSVDSYVTTLTPVLSTTQVIFRGSVPDCLPRNDSQGFFEYGKLSPRTVEGREAATIREDGTFEFLYYFASEGTLYYVKAGVAFRGEDYFGDEITFKLADFAPSEGEAIDMGYGLKWASCNVGASKPEDAGDYFAWGETATKTSFTQGNYLFPYTPESLSLDNDAAHAVMGGSWRMPTYNEFELLTDYERVIDEYGSYNGVPGHLLTSKKTGGRVFFPLAGKKEGDEIKFLGECAFYWSSTFSGSGGAYNLRCDGNSNLHTENSYENYLGYTVRGVCE